MADVIEHRKFVFVSNNLNSNKRWEVLLYDNDDVEVRYGRIGKSLQSKVHPGAGRRRMESSIRDKTSPSEHYDGGCYREIEVLDTAATSSPACISSSKSELKKIAKAQIATCPITQKLIEFFTEVNAHNISHATGGRITYDVSAGTFRTPVGIVTKSNVDAARTLLDDLTGFITKNSFGKPFITTLEDYLMLIPQDVGRKFDPRGFCGSIDAIQHQSQILDGLDASIQSVLSAPKNGKKKEEAETPKLFNVKLSVVDDKDILTEIRTFFNKGRHHGHRSYDLKITKAYAIDMPTMKDAWDRDGSKLNNQWKLFHGTKASNCLSILKNGFVIPPASASHVCGRMYSNGCYHSDESTKSLNYATNYWGGRDEGRYFMFYNLVAMGNYFIPSGSRSSPPPKGYDSYFAKAGQSGVMNNEMVVFRTSQILPLNLLEFE
jgi:poly [ADP-ribose] polymerase